MSRECNRYRPHRIPYSKSNPNAASAETLTTMAMSLFARKSVVSAVSQNLLKNTAALYNAKYVTSTREDHQNIYNSYPGELLRCGLVLGMIGWMWAIFIDAIVGRPGSFVVGAFKELT